MAGLTFEERLKKFPLFGDLTEKELDQVASFLEEKRFPSGSTLFNQGDPPDFFYLVEEGAVQETGRDQAGVTVLRRVAQPGEFVGRWSLMHDTPRRATATVLRETRTLAVKGEDLRTLLALFPLLRERLERTQVINRLLAIPLFGSFSREQLFHVADLARSVEYPAGQTIFSQGEPADAFYVIDTGQVVETVSGAVPGKQTWPKYFSAGSFFGRYALLRRTERRATAQAVTDVRLLRFSKGAFQWLRQLQPAFEMDLKRPDVLGYLRQTGVFARLQPEELKHLAGYVGLAHFRSGDVVYRQGEPDPTFYILYQGEAIVRVRDEEGQDRPLRYMVAVDWVGQSSLFLKVPRDVTLVATASSNWLYLTREDLDHYLAHRPEVTAKLMPKEEVKIRRNLARFPWMEEDEQLLLRIRRHWFFLMGRLALPIVVLFASLVLALVHLSRFVGLVLLAPAFLWTLWRLVDWLNDYYVVTTKRVAHREKVLMISERRDETPLDKVQNVNIAQDFWGNQFNFGKLLIDTAAAAGVTRVAFDYLGEPARVQALIFEQMRRARAGRRLEMHQFIRDKLSERVGTRFRPLVPRPAVPSQSPAMLSPPKLGRGRRLFYSLWGRHVWIEHRTEDSVTWRKHWIRLLTRLGPPTLLMLGLLAVLGLFLTLAQEGRWWVVLLMGILLAPAAFWWWWSWMDWGNDLYIVTNDRVIDVSKLPLGFRSMRTETTFDKIQNVSFDIPDPIATLLNYGTVFIHTAGAQGRLDFEYVRGPKQVQAEIFRRLSAYEEAQRRQRRDEQWADLPEWFAEYDRARRS